LKKFKFFLFFSLLQIDIFFVFSDNFDALILKIFFKKIKKNILMHFQVKSTLKATTTTFPQNILYMFFC